MPVRPVSPLVALTLAAFLLGSSVARAQEPGRAEDDDDGVHTVLCFSGGGTRAAAFAHGAALGLAEVQAGDRALLERVDRVIGVSGGSLTATQVALDRSPAALDRFAAEVLREDLERVMVKAAASSGYSFVVRDLTRGDVATGCFDGRLGATTFAALPARPELWIQTTDVVGGRPLVLSRASLAGLGLDPATLTVGRAIAASAAFPGIFPPVRFAVVPGVPDGVPDDVPDGGASTLFLADGGILDNLGLEPALDAPPPAGTRAVVLVVVNARCALPVDDATLASSIRSGIHALELQQRQLDALVLARARDRLRLLELEAALAGRALTTRLVVVDFSGSARRADLDAIETRFALDDEQVTTLIEEGRAIARERARALRDVW